MLSVKNLTRHRIDKLFKLADHVRVSNQNSLSGKILVNAFFEPSTRTSLSFESAMYRLGGNVITFNKEVSSIKKGESFHDTIKTLSLYGDAMVIRHPDKGAVEEASKISDIPVINGGDGDGEHPTQALLDLYTIYKSFPTIENLKILFIGDIKHSRTVNSLLDILKVYPRNKIFFLPYYDREPDYELQYNTSNNHTQYIEDLLVREQDICYEDYDVFYCTRMQKERSEGKSKVDFIIDNKKVELMHENAIIMHPLPRNEEISLEVDKSKKSKYFQQMEYGIDIRMALLLEIFNVVK
jgi:carbamoyl-phosphate synthase/aspartate carbamoyltransferase